MMNDLKQFAASISIKRMCIILSLFNILLPNDTFSIVAVDTLTGQIGSAGAVSYTHLTLPTTPYV